MVAYGPSVGSMLASNADRERAIDVLRAGFAEGRLTPPEFEDRMARVQESRTYDQLIELTGDLPAGPWALGPVGGPWASGTGVVPYRVRTTRPADPSFANLALTAVVVFTLAAIVTALTVYAHIHGGQAFGTPVSPAPAHLLPFTIKHP
jgi:hypothetical protein